MNLDVENALGHETVPSRVRSATRVLGLTVLAALVVVWAWNREPRFQGVGVTRWLAMLESPIYPGVSVLGPASDATQVNAAVVAALDHFGKAALPYVLRDLKAHDSGFGDPLRQWLTKASILGIRYTPASRRNHRALAALGCLGTNAMPILPELVDMLPKRPVGQSLVRVLVEIGSENDAFKQRVLDCAAAVAPSIQTISLTRSLDARDPRTHQVFLRGLQGDDTDVRRVASRILRETGSTNEQVVTRLVALLRDPDADVRHSAAFALARCDHHRAEAARLLALILRGPDPEMQLVALYALESLSGNYPAALEPIRGCADHPSRLIRETAVRVLDEWIERNDSPRRAAVSESVHEGSQ